MSINFLRNISIIVCAYNEQKTICNKIEDIADKDAKDSVDQVIIVDDNSTDKTFEIAQKCAKDYEKVIVVKNTHSKGKWGALVTGYEYAKGEIVCVTDADVMFEEDTLENALRLFDGPAVGAVTSNQKVILVKDRKETLPFVNFYERCRNFFRRLESQIDSTSAFHAQCMFFRRGYIALQESGLMADDLAIAIKLRRSGYKTLFCSDSYYIEKISRFFDKVSKSIFERRARAVTQTIIKNSDILFNSAYGKFGFICFPLEFFINIIFPFFAIATYIAAAIILLLLSSRYKLFILLTVFLIYISRQMFILLWYQATSVIRYLINRKDICVSWTTVRRED